MQNEIRAFDSQLWVCQLHDHMRREAGVSDRTRYLLPTDASYLIPQTAFSSLWDYKLNQKHNLILRLFWSKSATKMPIPGNYRCPQYKINNSLKIGCFLITSVWGGTLHIVECVFFFITRKSSWDTIVFCNCSPGRWKKQTERNQMGGISGEKVPCSIHRVLNKNESVSLVFPYVRNRW